MFEFIMFLPVILGGLATIATLIVVIIVITKAIKRHSEISSMTNTSTIASVFKKTMENAEAHLENTNAQFKKVTCPYCGCVNKGSDTKCAGCSAPLNQK